MFPLLFPGSPRTAGPQPSDVLRLGSFSRSPRAAGPQPRDVLRLALPLLEGFGAADDVEQLLGDLLLARLVVLDGENLDHLLRVLRRRLHRGHPRAVLAREGLHEGTEDLGPYVARQQVAEDRLR